MSLEIGSRLGCTKVQYHRDLLESMSQLSVTVEFGDRI